MASSKTGSPQPPTSAKTATHQGQAKPQAARGPAAVVRAGTAAAREALAAAKSLPGWRAACTLLGSALVAGNSALLLESRGQAVAVRRRIDGAWQQPEPLGGDDAAAAVAALKKLVVSAASGQQEPEYEISARSIAARACRMAARHGAAGEDLLVLVGAERPQDERTGIGGRLAATLGGLVPGFGRRKAAVHAAGGLPRVTLEPTGPEAAARRDALLESAGYGPACEMVAAAVQERAGAILLEAAPQAAKVEFDVDGVVTPAPVPPAAAVKGVVGVLQALAGFDPKVRAPQSATITALVDDKPWPCSVVARYGSSSVRIEVAIDKRRPTFKTLADLGASPDVAARMQEFLALESGLLIVTAPRRGGLSTLFTGMLTAADRLLRDFVLLEDAAAPRPEIQNVRPVRWDSRTGGTPVAALEGVLREYPNVLATCDLEDKELARQLVAQAGEGRLVIVGLRGADAADGIARLAALGVDPQAIARVLLGAVGCQLVRKLCPQCREEYFPALDLLAKFKIDLGADVTLFRAAAAGCAACTGTGHLGRTGAYEVAAGPTLRAYVAKAADADVLRKAAIKDGMVALVRDAIAKAARGETSVEEVQRVFRKG
jgi:type II secretory ATPase GspE/PulE/Tfp pilus assembly ATPase PilB-like protein